MNAVFLDTVGLLATWDESDQWHALAEAAFQKFVSAKRQMVTTPQVLFACGNASARKPYRTRVSALRNALALDGLIIEPSAAEISAAWAEFDRMPPGQPGIVDLISFTVMRRCGLMDAFTNDRHFAGAGFNRLF